jgi:hypothetical protein
VNRNAGLRDVMDGHRGEAHSATAAAQAKYIFVRAAWRLNHSVQGDELGDDELSRLTPP